jgi:hypothetical protein
MMPGHVPSSPHLIRPVLRSTAAWIALLLLAAVWIPAPLERAADPAHAPNPAKAAWFLVWVQELVSHGTWWMYPVLVLAAVFVAFPWLRRTQIEHAEWFRRGERLMAVATAGLVLAVLVLTLVGLLFRGEQWRLIAPF